MFQIVTVLFKFFGFAKAGLTFLVERPKILALVVAIAVAVFGYWKVSSTIGELNERVVAEQKMRDAERRAKEEAVKANEENLKTIRKLERDRKLAEESSQRLRERIKQDSKTLEDLMGRVTVVKPSDDGPISPVLAETINGVQNSRKGR